MPTDRKTKQGRNIDCNVRQELAEVADAVTERKRQAPAGKRERVRENK